MPRRCTICRHPQHEEIGVSLLRDGTRATARKFGLSLPALDRHKKHLPANIIQAQQGEMRSQTTALLVRVEQLIEQCEHIATAAQREKDWPSAMGALREVRNCLEFLGRLQGELECGPKVRIGVAVSLGAQSAGTLDEAQLELAIAQHVAAATNNFDPKEIARLRGLLDPAAESKPCLGEARSRDADVGQPGAANLLSAEA